MKKQMTIINLLLLTEVNLKLLVSGLFKWQLFAEEIIIYTASLVVLCPWPNKTGHDRTICLLWNPQLRQKGWALICHSDKDENCLADRSVQQNHSAGSTTDLTYQSDLQVVTIETDDSIRFNKTIIVLCAWWLASFMGSPWQPHKMNQLISFEWNPSNIKPPVTWKALNLEQS